MDIKKDTNMSDTHGPEAPELAISEWFNTTAPITLAALRGRPVFLHTFQLLCPGCLANALPQVQRIERVFSRTDLQIIGVHTVFELHESMTPAILKGFIEQKEIRYPVGVDVADEKSDIPITMQRYQLRGTPSSVLIGRDGSVIHQVFGVEDDLIVGARIGMALGSGP